MTFSGIVTVVKPEELKAAFPICSNELLNITVVMREVYVNASVLITVMESPIITFVK